jgi:hypothetical protein
MPCSSRKGVGLFFGCFHFWEVRAVEYLDSAVTYGRESYLHEVDEFNPSCRFQNNRILIVKGKPPKKAASHDAIRTWLWSELGPDCQTPLTVDVVDNEESLGLTLRITSISSTLVATCSSFGDANEPVADNDSLYSRCTLTSSKLCRKI